MPEGGTGTPGGLRRKRGRPRGSRTTDIIPSRYKGHRNTRHQALWKRLLSLGFTPDAVIRAGLGGKARWGFSWMRVSAYHKGLGIAVQIAFREGNTERNLKFLTAHCARLFVIKDDREFYQNLKSVTETVRGWVKNDL